MNADLQSANLLSHKQYWMLLAVLLLAFFLRAYQLDRQALRGDEAATVLYSAMPLNELWELSRVTDPHPPLYYAMLHPWQWLVSEEGWAMRFAGVMAGTFAVAALYALAQRTLYLTGISLLAAALLAINPLQIWLAQDIRSYPFFTLFGLLSSLALWQALQGGRGAGSQSCRVARSQSRRDIESHPFNSNSKTQNSKLKIQNSKFKTYLSWLLYMLLTVASLYIHYYTVFLIAFQGLFVLANIKRFWSKKRLWLASQIAIGLLIIPGLQLAYNFVGQAAGGIDKIPTQDILRLASTALLTGFTIDDFWGLWVSLLLLPVWIIGIITLFRTDFTRATFWTFFFAVPVIGVIALSIDRPFFKERFLIQAQPAFELLLAVGFLTLWQHIPHPTSHIPHPTSHVPHPASHTRHTTHYALRFITIALLILLLFANLTALTNYFTNPVYAKSPPWHLYRDYVSRHSGPNDVMLTNFPEASVSYYSPNNLPFYVVPVERDRSLEFRLEQTEQIANAYERIWFLPLLRQGFDEQGDVLKWLDRHADRVNQVFFPAYNINLYLSPPTIAARLIEQSFTFAHGLHLRGFQIFDEDGQSRLKPGITETGSWLRVEPGDEFTLSLYWQADGPTNVPYTVFTHLIAADGFTVTSHDNQPVWGSYPTTEWSLAEKITDKYTLTVPPGTGPGDYRLRVGWYQSDTLERVPVLDEAGQATADHIILDLIIRVE